MQGLTCYGQQAQAKEKEQDIQKDQQGAKCSNWEKMQIFFKNKKRRKTEKELHHFQEIQISDHECKKSVSNLAESVECGEILSSSSEWKIGSEELFVTCLNEIEKIK